jgi:CubicO group peptidase (beta-lactamase class C family)
MARSSTARKVLSRYNEVRRVQTDHDEKQDRLRAMMRPYASAHHSVVAFDLDGETAGFLHSGVRLTDVPPEDVIFEIGSITKVFTGILLCLLVEEGKVDPRAPLAEMSADLADVPTQLTPERLISHTSGLPNIHKPIWQAVIRPMPEGPYADFSRADLLRWLRNWNGQPDRAVRHAYSNLGVGLLGEAMAIQAGRPFPARGLHRGGYPGFRPDSGIRGVSTLRGRSGV